MATVVKQGKEDRFAKFREQQATTPRCVTPDKTDAYMRKKATMMWNDPEWHSHSRPNVEIPIHENLKFIAYINPVIGIELHFYRKGRKEETTSWYSVGKFKAIGCMDEACQTLAALMEDVGGNMRHVADKLKKYVKDNPYDNKKYADVEAWLDKKTRGLIE